MSSAIHTRWAFRVVTYRGGRMTHTASYTNAELSDALARINAAHESGAEVRVFVIDRADGLAITPAQHLELETAARG